MYNKTYLVLTVDTETDFLNNRVIPVSKMIYGEVEGHQFGITKIMDICDKYNSKATFFLSTFETRVLGEEPIRKVCRAISSRGHDVQLHTHPKWITNKRFMHSHSLQEQLDLLIHGRRMMTQWLGQPPIAHRSGGFGADNNTLSALKQTGFNIDSSFLSAPNCKLRHTFKPNTVQLSPEKIIQLPVTEFAQFDFFGFRPVKPFDINANTLDELKFVLSTTKSQNGRIITLLMHSFSFLRRNKDRTRFSVNWEDILKFERFLQLVANDNHIETITVSQFFHLHNLHHDLFTNESYLPVSGYPRSTARAVRYIEKGKGNKLLALSFFFLVSAIIISYFLIFRLLAKILFT